MFRLDCVCVFTFHHLTLVLLRYYKKTIKAKTAANHMEKYKCWHLCMHICEHNFQTERSLSYLWVVYWIMLHLSFTTLYCHVVHPHHGWRGRDIQKDSGLGSLGRHSDLEGDREQLRGESVKLLCFCLKKDHFVLFCLSFQLYKRHAVVLIASLYEFRVVKNWGSSQLTGRKTQQLVRSLLLVSSFLRNLLFF